MLTDTEIRNAQPSEKPRRLYDSGGLYLEVSPQGKKGWRLKYRFGGKEKRISLGIYPDVSLKEARTRRDAARATLAAGIDPSLQRKAKKAAALQQAANSFELIAREWFLRYSPTWAKSHSKTVIRRLEMDIFPWLGVRAISEITAPELLTVIRQVEGRGALETAHRELNICGQVFRYAIATGRAERDPSRDLQGALPPVKTKHLAAVTDPKRLGELLRMMYAYQGGLVVRCALRLAPLVFVRPGELRSAKWPDIDLEKGEWRYLVSKTQTEHIVPLSRQAVEILKELHPLTQHRAYVFTNPRSPQRPMSENAVLVAMRAMGIEKDEMTGHGWRATARTLLDEVLGFRPELIEHQLSHAVKDPLGRAYNRTTHLEERRKMMQSWADYLDLLRGGCNGN
ncbi:integrase [Neosynechococcus sphagnicola sy1]|uniref:Integrase n=1 Tax=Neosynechococcus sphagnicola sy1 TaxID=1497020 RepID=A0A098TKM9_9CYAN|nr:integrase arm-type DNA-binding domain-containing protein [Neosynechococcus sphagnicola]KGF72844.1 integrase [Neosynechococcus sphagnicola sy1]